MFFSLSKKILYSLIAFLFLIALLFLSIFINLYSQKIADNQNTIYMRNEYVLNLLYDNIRLKKQIAEIGKNHPNIIKGYNIYSISKELDSTVKELTSEQKLNEELKKNYDNNAEAIKTGAKVIGYSLVVVVMLILLLIFLLDYWVIRPTERISNVSRQVSKGIYSSRLPLKQGAKLQDEFDILYSAYNQMLDSIEDNIAQVKNREHYLQQLIDAIPEGIRVIDKNFNVMMTNQAFNNMFKITETSVGQKCYQAYGYKCEECPQSRYNCPVRNWRKNINSEAIRTIHEVGKTPFYVTAAKLKISAKEYYIIEALHDLSADIKYSHQQKVSSLGFLSTSIAHEMKNNLGAIRMILEGLLDSEYKDVADDDAGKKYLTMAHNQLIEAVKTPERLLRLAQYSEDEVTEVDVKSAVGDMVLMIDYDAKRHGISVDTVIDDNIVLMTNEADFKMIILNLVQNAIKAMPKGGQLYIEGSKNNRGVVIKIKDNGIGIEAGKIKHIFEPFYSANSQAKSSGLGLAIVSSLVEKNKGKIAVKSKVGEGTEFTLRFPQIKNEKKPDYLS